LSVLISTNASGRPPLDDRDREPDHLSACVSLVFSLVIGFVLAALLDQKIRFENTFRTIMLYPFALSFIVTGLVWQWILNPEFGIQHVIRALGWESFTFDPLYNPASSSMAF
jgi:ABC-type sugar transport system permease subunit